MSFSKANVIDSTHRRSVISIEALCLEATLGAYEEPEGEPETRGRRKEGEHREKPEGYVWPSWFSAAREE